MKKSNKKREVQEQFLKRMINSKTSHERFEDLYSKRQKINAKITSELREKTGESISKGQRQWISHLSLYKQSAFAKIPDKLHKAEGEPDQSRSKLVAEASAQNQQHSEIEDSSWSIITRQNMVPLNYAYDKGSLSKYLLGFVHLSRMSQEIDRLKTTESVQLDKNHDGSMVGLCKF